VCPFFSAFAGGLIIMIARWERRVTKKEFYMLRKNFRIWALIIGKMFIGAVAIGFTACNTLFGDTSETNENYGWYGNGSSSDFTIKNFAQLEGFAKIVSGDAGWTDKDGKTHYIEKSDFRGKTVTLGNNIDMTGKSWSGIGYVYLQGGQPFNGTFDGDHKTISGMPGGGFFMDIGEGGIVKNIVFVDVNLNYNWSGGAVVAEGNRGTIQNISVSGSISGGTLNGGGGGLVCQNYGTVENCSFSGNFSATDLGFSHDGGGIAGKNEAGGIIRNCGFTGNNTGNGGIASDNHGTIESCYSTGTVTRGGGIVGSNYGGTIKNCYSTGSSIGGGIAARNTDNATIQNCYATGNVTGSTHVGGIAGGGSGNSSVQNCAALNSSITETANTYSLNARNENGRIIAKPDNNCTLSNNYGKSGLSIGSYDNSIVVTPSISGQHGEDIAASVYNTQTWWQNTLNWDFDTVWEWDSARNLPTLRLDTQE
jgi:hypothetical protein